MGKVGGGNISRGILLSAGRLQGPLELWAHLIEGLSTYTMVGYENVLN